MFGLEAGLVSALGGGLMRLFGWGAEFFTKRQENTHELALLDKQIELESYRHTQKMEEIHVTTDSTIDVKWADALDTAIAAQAVKSGVWWVDALNAAIRPILTIWWCLVLYTIYKGAMLYLAVKADVGLAVLAPMLFTEFDAVIVGSIIGFWFVDRQLRKLSAK